MLQIRDIVSDKNGTLMTIHKFIDIDNCVCDWFDDNIYLHREEFNVNDIKFIRR